MRLLSPEKITERQLRFTIGLPPEDGCRLVPNDEPTLAPYTPDWCTALNEALEPNGVAVVMEALQKNPPAKPKRPAFPNYHPAAGPAAGRRQSVKGPD